jgi:hypothetical protein
MTQNNSNELNQFIFPKKEETLTGPNAIKMLDAAERVVARLDAELKDAKVKLDAHESLWKASQKVITDLTVENINLNKTVAHWKQEFSDCSKQSIDTLNMMQNTKHALESVMEQFFKHENK